MLHVFGSSSHCWTNRTLKRRADDNGIQSLRLGRYGFSELIDPLPLRHVTRKRPESRMVERAFDRSGKAPDIMARLKKSFGEVATNA